jgi:hypothetical protein
MIWRAKFTGRRINAIGIFYPIIAFCYGENEKEAELNLYERFEHIQRLTLEPREVTIIKACKVGDKIYRVENGKLIGETDPRNSAWTVVGGDAFPGFVNCMDAGGTTHQLNDGLQCIIRQPDE